MGKTSQKQLFYCGEHRAWGQDIHLNLVVQYLGRGFHRSIGWGGDYTDDWHCGGQWLGQRCRHRRRRRRRRKKGRGNNSRHHHNREWQRRGRGSHHRCWCGNQGKGGGGYTGLKIGGKAKKRRRQTEKMIQRLRYIRKNGEGKQRQQHKKGERGACLCLREIIDLNMVWPTTQKDLIKGIKDMRWENSYPTSKSKWLEPTHANKCLFKVLRTPECLSYQSRSLNWTLFHYSLLIFHCSSANGLAS